METVRLALRPRRPCPHGAGLAGPARLFGLLLALIALIAPALPASAGRGGPRVLSDTGGRIRRVLCVVHSSSRMPLNDRFLADFREKLGPGAEILLLEVGRDRLGDLRGPGATVRRIALPQSTHLTVWPQDPFLVLRNGRERASWILASPYFARAEDAAEAALVARTLGVPLLVAGFDFEGGNLVADSKTVFVGGDTVAAAAARLRLGRADVLELMRRDLGRRVAVIGGAPQAVGHLDMVLTPLGGRAVALADPVLGANLVRDELAAHPDSARSFEELSLHTFASAALKLPIAPELAAGVKLPPVAGRTPAAIAYSRSLEGWFRQVEGELRSLGYAVHRIPYLAPPGGGSYDNADWLGACYPDLSYNNVLIERPPLHKPVVYLPEYGFAVLDRAARKAWEAIGFEVKPVAGLLASAMYGGSLRCAVKVLERESRKRGVVASRR